jgi:DNA helicase-2/ATP-dependent DNA helicase PcrA
LSEVAVLYRSNAQSRVLEHALFNAAIPYRVYGGMRFFERAEIKNALAYLRLSRHRGRRRVPAHRQLSAARDRRADAGDARRRRAPRRHDAVAGRVRGGKVGGKGEREPRVFRAAHRADARGDRRLVAAGSGRARQRGIRDFSRTIRNEKDGQDRVDNLAELVNAAQSFVREADLAVDAPIVAADSSDAEAGGRLGRDGPADRLSRARGARGGRNAGSRGPPGFAAHDGALREGTRVPYRFHHGSRGGPLPHENSRDEVDGMEEERRLMYVAITRAKRRLYVTHAQSRMLHGQIRYNIPSRFLDELPRELVHWLSPPRRRMAAAVDIDPAEWGERAAAFASSPGRAPAARSVPEPAHGWRIGQSVRHAKFGLGIIIDAEGRGGDSRVQVNFRDAGVKWLALEYAKLEAA